MDMHARQTTINCNLRMSNKQLIKETLKKSPLTTISKIFRNKSIRCPMLLPKKNYKPPLGEANEPRKYKDIPYLRTGRFNIVKMATIPQTIYIVITIPNELLTGFVVETNTNTKIYGHVKGIE